MEKKRNLYFAYGSNMNQIQMKKRCPESSLLGKATVSGYSFGLDEHRVATIHKNSKKYIEGLVYEISENDEKSLDRYEGVSSGCYRKEYLEIPEYPDSKVLVYISNRKLLYEKVCSSYLEDIILQAEINDFSSTYKRQIKKCSRNHYFETVESIRDDVMKNRYEFNENMSFGGAGMIIKEIPEEIQRAVDLTGMNQNNSCDIIIYSKDAALISCILDELLNVFERQDPHICIMFDMIASLKKSQEKGYGTKKMIAALLSCVYEKVAMETAKREG